ncbi:hypothetical protein HID58_087989 [Brassica napus]|uniref:Uncharacterized protein n=1 Tax=Brassica napus TaxID=3708 RepID=A0ABQ7XUX1_BRANA|nr:hypothetical protein HID58_087989 [Brassica napus]
MYAKVAGASVEFISEIFVLGTAIFFGLELPLQDVSQISEYRRIVVIVVGRQRLLREYNLDASAISRMLFVGGGVSPTTLRRRYTAVYGGVSPEFEAFFCDLPCNDFNMLFRLLTEKQKVASSRYFAGGVAGSFYDRLFPRGTIHVAVSLSALHWLSQIPEKVLEKGSRTWNKGKTWVEGAKKEVVDAYAEQSDKDLDDFLKCRKAEMVKGGVLFVLMTGRPSGSSSQFV